MEKQHKVIIVDDHPIVREGLIKLVESNEAFSVVGNCGDGAEVIPLIKKTEPDIIVLDISLPNLNGLQIVEEMKKEKLPGEVIILTMYARKSIITVACTRNVEKIIEPRKKKIIHQIKSSILSVVFLLTSAPIY